MKTILTSALVVLISDIAAASPAIKQARADTPPSECKQESIYAIVRMPSHGGSATVIYTSTEKTYLLSCGHCFEFGGPSKPIALDVPSRKHKDNHAVKCTLIDVDYDLDLSLIELNDGPLEFVSPVAPAGYRPSHNLLSIGYDNMQTPATVRKATITATDTEHTFTAERPWHGRSGGALLDTETGMVVGVVSGYETIPWGRGIYVSHKAIIRFLNRDHVKPSPRTPQWKFSLPFFPEK